LVLGKPMEFWEAMPPAMFLKSPWSASSLSDPGGHFSLARYARDVKASTGEPIPLPYFIEYGRWFQRSAAIDVEPTYVHSLSGVGGEYVIGLASGRVVRADRVIIAVGIRAFAHLPEFVHDLPPWLASHTQMHRDLSRFGGRSVAVVGSGQSALEWAALLNETGADVEVISRGPVRWVHRRLYDTPARRIFYPWTDVGPPGINWLVAFPLVLRRLPSGLRLALHRRSVRPAGAKWLRHRVDDRVRITQGTTIRSARPKDGHLRLALADGTTRDVEHLLLGTGYRPDISRIRFLDPAIRQGLRTVNGFPVLNQWFESSMPRLHFAGGAAGWSFGPLCNFVAGAAVPARQIAACASRRS
jgi:FAD-dependent urate hydroxylase